MGGKYTIKPGTRLELLVDDDKSEQGQELRSIFEKEESENIYIIAAPTQKNTLYPMHEGEYVSVIYLDNKSLYSFYAKVSGRVVIDNMPYLRIKRTTDIKKTQRRDDFRIDISLQLKIERFIPEPDTNKFREEVVAARAIDISGGGLAIKTNSCLESGEKTTIEMDLEGAGVIRIGADIRWIKPCSPEDVYKYHCGIAFVHKNPRDKEKIVKYVFAQQLKQMRKPNKPLTGDF